MLNINKNVALQKSEIELIISQFSFVFPNHLVEFYEQSNGAEILSDDNYVIIWPLEEVPKLNKAYNIDSFASNFFIFGTNGGDLAYVIEKRTGAIYELPFIGMSNDEAVFISNNLEDFFKNL